MRTVVVVLAIAAAAGLSHAQNTDAEGNTVVMHGPVTTDAVQPCADECLCDKPWAPQAPYIISVSQSEIVLGIGKTSANHLCDSASQVQMELNEDGAWTTVYNGPMNVVAAKKLRSDETVRFRVRERNCAGVSPYSPLLTTRTTPVWQKPPPPELVSSNTRRICVSANLTEVPVGDDFNAATDATVAYREVAADGTYSPSWTELNGFDNNTGQVWSVCVDGLMSATFYQFRVHIASAKINPLSDGVLFHTEAEAPPAPTKPVLLEATDATLRVQWSRVPDPSNRSPASVYLVHVASLEHSQAAPQHHMSFVQAQPKTSNTTSPFGDLKFLRVVQTPKQFATIKGLSPGLAYAVKVVAVNEAGESPPSELLFATTAATVPSAPSFVNFTAATSDSVRVAWGAAAPNGSPLLKYSLEQFGGTAAEYTEVYAGTRQHHRLEGLEPNVWYGFRVRAENAIGVGPYSKQIFVKTPMPGEALSPEDLTAASMPIDHAAAAAATAATSLVQQHNAPVVSATAEAGDNEEDEPLPAQQAPKVHKVKRVSVSGRKVINVLQPSVVGDQVLLDEDPDIDDLTGMADISKASPSTDTPQLELAQQGPVNPDPESDNLSGSPSITDGTVPPTPAPVPVDEVPIDGRCSANRGDCMEKNADIRKVYFTCSATQSTANVSPTLSPKCANFTMESLTAEGNSLDRSPEEAYNLTQTGCACTCSGDNEFCPVATLRYFSGPTTAQECAQVICSSDKFSICRWKGELVSEGTWAEDDLTFTAPALQGTCANITTDPNFCPNNCGGFARGWCQTSGKCRCARGWTGKDCSTALCPHRYNGCGNHGLCARPNVCLCDEGYGGDSCHLYQATKFSRHVTRAAAVNASKILANKIDNQGLNGVRVLSQADEALPDGVQQVNRLKRRSKSESASALAKPLSGGTRLGLPFFDALDLGTNRSFTVSLWFKATKAAANQDRAAMLSHGNFRHGRGWGVGILRTGVVYCGVGSDREPYRATNIAMAVSLDSYADDKFHHVACAFSTRSKTLTMMIDGNRVHLQQPWPYKGGSLSKNQGVLDTSELAPLSPVAHGQPLVVGASWDMNDAFFDGYMSEVRLWSVARTSDDVAKDMWQSTLPTPPPANLRLQLPLRDCNSGLSYTQGVVPVNRTAVPLHLVFSPRSAHLRPGCEALAHPLAVDVDVLADAEA